MGAIADVDAQDMLRSKFGATAPSAKPATWEIALSSTQPSLASDGTVDPLTVHEPTTGGYARQSLPNDDASWTFSTRSVSNNVQVSWTVGTGGWDVQPGYALLVNPDTGKFVGFGALGVTASGVEGSQVTLGTGTVTVNIPN